MSAGRRYPKGGSFWTLHVPEALQRKYHLAPRYDRICFDRALALRTRSSELGGIGHPLSDALLAEAKDASFPGSAARIGNRGRIVARYLVQYEDEGGRAQTRVMSFALGEDGAPNLINSIDWLEEEINGTDSSFQRLELDLKAAFTDALAQHLVEWQPDRTKRAGVQTSLIGGHVA